MKILKFILFCIITTMIISCSSKKTIDSLNKKLKIATQNKNEYSFVIDTLSYKIQISKNIFSEDSKVKFDKIQICEGITIDKYKKPYFFLKLSDFKKNIVTVRYLLKDRKDFFLTNYSNSDSFYVTCAGSDMNCNPNLYINDNLEKNWTCSDIVELCSADSLNCRIFRSILME
jgi:hypothetical protein